MEALDILINEALQTTDTPRSDLKITLRQDDSYRPCIDISNRMDLITPQDTVRMIFEEYSLKTKKVGGLRRLNVISVENDCRLRSCKFKSINNKTYLQLSYLL